MTSAARQNPVSCGKGLYISPPEVFHTAAQTLTATAFGRTWCEAIEAKQQGDRPLALKLLRKLTRGFMGIADVPGALVLEELLELYPEAKVILVLCDPQRWAKNLDGKLVAGTASHTPIINEAWCSFNASAYIARFHSVGLRG